MQRLGRQLTEKEDTLRAMEGDMRHARQESRAMATQLGRHAQEMESQRLALTRQDRDFEDVRKTFQTVSTLITGKNNPVTDKERPRTGRGSAKPHNKPRPVQKEKSICYHHLTPEPSSSKKDKNAVSPRIQMMFPPKK